MGNSTRNADKKSTKTGQNDKTKERHWNILEQKGKGKMRKNNSKIWGNKPETTGEGRKIKGQNNIDKTGHSKTTKKNSTINWVEMMRKYTNNWMQEKPNELERLEEGPKAEIHIDLHKTTLKTSN